MSKQTTKPTPAERLAALEARRDELVAKRGTAKGDDLTETNRLLKNVRSLISVARRRMREAGDPSHVLTRARDLVQEAHDLVEGTELMVAGAAVVKRLAGNVGALQKLAVANAAAVEKAEAAAAAAQAAEQAEAEQAKAAAKPKPKAKAGKAPRKPATGKGKGKASK